MTIGIYSITNCFDGKRYIGKSIEIERRWVGHRMTIRDVERYKETMNPNLRQAVLEYGPDCFVFEMVEVFEEHNEAELADAELKWMDHYKSYDPRYGYNLRRDSATSTIVGEDTKLRLSMANTIRYSDPVSGPQERAKVSAFFKKHWAEMPEERKKQIGRSIAKRMQKYFYAQCDIEGNRLIVWRSTEELKNHYPKINIQNVHSVADGHKASYMGFIWEKVDPASVSEDELFGGSAPEIDWDRDVTLSRWWVECIDPHEGPVDTFKSIAEAASAFGVSYGFMNNCVNGRIDLFRGYRFRKIQAPHLSLQETRKIMKKYIFTDLFDAYPSAV